MLFLAIAMMTGTVNGIAAPRSGVFNGNQYGEVTPPNSSTFTNMGAHTIEFRIHGLSATRPADQIIFYTDDTSCVLQANSTVMRCRTWRGTSHFVDLSLGTSTDIRARVQYDPAATRFSAEIWNGDGSGYKISQFSAPLLASYNATRPLSIGGLASVGRLTGSIAFFRWTAGLVGLNGPPPPDIAATPASLFDYGFENNLTDASPTGRNLLMNGSGFGYQDSPTYLPASVVSSPLANRAAFETQLDGRRSFSSVGTGNMTRYQWQQVGGPYPAEIQKPNSALTAVIMPVAGTYTFRLEVTDELGQTAASEIRVGAVATDDNNIVFIDKPDIAFLLGTMTQSGTSPWPWYDQTEIRVADQLGLALPPSPGETPATGNISVSAGSPTINGSGTAFRTLFACNGSDLIVIRYPVPGGGTGRRAYTVTACASDQQLTIAPAYDASANATLVQYAKMTQVEQAAWSGGGNNWNYYDAVAAFYRLYYRTGQSIYRTYARTLADRWWTFPLDAGRACPPDTGNYCPAPRVKAILGMMLRASDGRPEMWPGIKSMIDLDFQIWIQNGLGVNDDTVYDIREAGYVFYFLTLMAKIHPDATIRQQSLAKANDAFQRYWKIRQRTDGSWRMDIGAGNPSLGYIGKGTLPWQIAFILKGLISLHQQTGNAEVFDSIKRAADFVSGFAYNTSCRGLWYTVLYQICQGVTCAPCTFANGQSGTCEGNVCTGAPRSDMTDRTFSNASHEIFGYVYSVTGEQSYKTVGDDLFSANFGGNGGGPGADGGNGSFADVITYGPTFALGKEFGFVAGVGAAPRYLSYRLGGPLAADQRTFQIDFDLGQVPGATQVKMNVTRPDASGFFVICTTSPCAINVDARQGSHLLMLEYLNDNDEVLSSGEPLPLVVR
ncbi:MAG: PKD domain-containing protein [Acidobacteriota bacterium]|jgi:hypothetical protein